MVGARTLNSLGQGLGTRHGWGMDLVSLGKRFGHEARLGHGPCIAWDKVWARGMVGARTLYRLGQDLGTRHGWGTDLVSLETRFGHEARLGQARLGMFRPRLGQIWEGNNRNTK